MADIAACTGVILAGGRSSRFGGDNKAFMEVAGKSMLDHLFDRFSEVFQQVVLVSNTPEKHLDKDALIVSDLFDVRSALTGIHTGLFYATTPYAFFSACDTPFLKKELIEAVVRATGKGVDIALPRTRNGFEPLCAAYSARLLDPVTRMLESGDLKIRDLFQRAKVREIPEETLRKADPELISFTNVNTPEDLAAARRMEPGTPE